MSKKKKDIKPGNFAETVGFKNIFQNDKIKFISGLLLVIIALYLIIAFISFLITGDVDQSLVEDPAMSQLRDVNNDAQNYCGSIGAQISYFLINCGFGLPAFFIPLFIIFAGLNMMKAYTVNLWKWFFCTVIVMLWSAVTCAKFLTPFFINSHISPGGFHGLFVTQWLESQIGEPGLIGVLLILAVAFLTYLSAETITIIRKALNPVKYFSNKVTLVITNNIHKEEEEKKSKKDVDEAPIATQEDPKTFDDPVSEVVDFNEEMDTKEKHPDNAPIGVAAKEQKDTTPEAIIAGDMKVEVPEDVEKATSNTVVNVDGNIMEPYDPKRDLENYHYPTLDLLKKYENDGKPYIDMEEQKANKDRIINVLRNFGVEINSIKATVGPTITLYEITPAQGVKISKIRNLEDDIALSLSALGIRIIAPIPGKGTIGIEVPNAKPAIVSMESILNSRKFQETTMELPIALGKTITNEVFMVDLAKLPHLLVAGATGQGKSVGLNAIITSLLYKKHPSELKFVLIDPKKVEFSVYAPIERHFLAKLPDGDDAIITDVTKVVQTLNSLCSEMDTRYDLLRKAGCRNIKEYNAKFISRKLNPEKGHRFMPYIVIIIDEFGDLIMTAW